MMFAIGLACVPFSNAVYDKLTDIPVDLPQVESDAPIIVLPKNKDEISCCWRSHCDCGFRAVSCFRNKKQDKKRPLFSTVFNYYSDKVIVTWNYILWASFVKTAISSY